MAVTINKYPENTVNPITIPTEFSVSSDNTAQDNFKYICDVYAAGATRPERLRQSAHPTNGYCVFNVSGVLKSWITNDAPVETIYAAFRHASNSYNNFAVKFGEEYGASSALVVYPNLTTETNYYVFNGTLDFDEWAGGVTTITEYTLSANTKKFLTNSPSQLNVDTNTVAYLYFLNGTNTASTAYNAVFKSYDSSGTLLQTMRIGTDYNTANKIQYFGVGPYNFDYLTGAETRFSITTALPFIDTTVSYYTVYIENSSSSPISETKRYNIVDDCNVGTTYIVMFQNKMGGYDTMRFTAPSDYSVDIKRDFFKKRQGAWSGTSYSYTGSQRSKTQYNTLYNDEIKIRSEWITEDESTWLEELATSPDVYVLNVDTRKSVARMVPFNILDSKYNRKEYGKDQLFNLELTVEHSFDRYRQQR